MILFIQQIIKTILQLFSKKQNYTSNQQIQMPVQEQTLIQEQEIKPMEIIDVPNFTNYIKQKVNKNKVVIHGTYGGTYAGALQTFKTGSKGVATHFIISQDAKIYRLFPQEYFAYHAGKDFRTISQTSFGIEIVNWLSLKKIDGQYYAWTNKKIPMSRVKIVERWRNCKSFHTITPQQHKSLQFLLKYLCQKYNIRKKLYRQYDPKSGFNTKDFTGILFHSSFHSTRHDFEPSIIPPISI